MYYNVVVFCVTVLSCHVLRHFRQAASDISMWPQRLLPLCIEEGYMQNLAATFVSGGSSYNLWNVKADSDMLSWVSNLVLHFACCSTCAIDSMLTSQVSSCFHSHAMRTPLRHMPLNLSNFKPHQPDPSPLLCVCCWAYLCQAAKCQKKQ